MEKNSYHHGALKEELIRKGIELIREEGMTHFSLRKVAAACQVSHTAPYKHFKNKEELIEAIMEYIVQDFSQALRAAVESNPGPASLLAVGKCYVSYMLEHRDYFNVLFLGEKKLVVRVNRGKFEYEKGHPFGAFVEIATEYFKDMIQDETLRNDIILQCWSTVHGIAHLVISGIVQYEGEVEALVESMLRPMKLCQYHQP